MSDIVGDKNSKTVISNTQARILTELRNNPNIMTPQIAKKLSLAKSAIDKAMVVLKKTGVVERVGSNKTGYWHVIE